MRRFLPALVAALLAPLAASTARADVTSSSPVFMPVPTALTLHPLFGEPTSLTTGLAPPLAVMPLRLSMLGMAFPRAGSLPSDPFNCNPDANGNSQYGFPVEHQVYLAMTSRLALHAFSRLGCPLDSAVGGAVTYTLPLSHDVSIVPSAGVLARSTLDQGRVRTAGSARVDLMLGTAGDRTLGIGIGRQRGVQGVQIVGTW